MYFFVSITEILFYGKLISLLTFLLLNIDNAVFTIEAAFDYLKSIRNRILKFALISFFMNVFGFIPKFFFQKSAVQRDEIEIKNSIF